MRNGRPCPESDCRQRFQTDHGIASHYQRVHADRGRWRGRAMTDGGEVETDIDRETVRSRVQAIEVCIAEGNDDRAEDGLLQALSEVRQLQEADR